MTVQNKLPVAYPLIVLVVWATFLLLYLIFKNNSSLDSYSAYFPLIGETSLDAAAVLLAFNLKIQTHKKKYKKIFLILSISFVASLIADLTYNIILNLFEFKYENVTLAILFDVPFALFLLLQLIVMSHIIFLNKTLKEKKRKTIYMPNIILSILIFIVFMFGIPWKISYFSAIGLFQFLDTSLEAIGFVLATICLARSKSKLIYFITIGYLIIVASDFMIRYFVITGSVPYLSTFEMTWVLGLIVTCIGLYLGLKETKTDILKLMPKTSLQSQLTIWSLILWLGSLLLFTVWNYYFNEFKNHGQITVGFLSIIVPCSVLVIMGSNLLATKISSKLAELESIINNFIKTDSTDISYLKNQVECIKNKSCSENEKFEIHEVEQLYNFIMNTVTELQLANRVKADFLMKMSHDFRTPASGIYSMSHSIYKRIEDPKLKNLQLLIVKSAEQLINILEEVLDYSRLDSNQYNLNIKAIDIKSIINEVILLVSAKVEEKKLSIIFQPNNLSISYSGDRLLIHRIILNLVSNAIKFTYTGGISINLNIEEFEKKEWIVIKIIDTGIGIDKAYHKAIFEPFYCIESLENSKYPGVGLGLSNVQLMLRRMNGQLILESNLNQGTTFSILLPI